jgi:hypothetical protein
LLHGHLQTLTAGERPPAERRAAPADLPEVPVAIGAPPAALGRAPARRTCGRALRGSLTTHLPLLMMSALAVLTWFPACRRACPTRAP